MGWWSGSKDKVKQQSLLSKSQQPLQSGLEQAAQGAYGDVGDYYRGNLSDNPQDFDAFAAPQMRQYNEDIVPGLSEQFAGMGSGGLSSSGFRNAQIQGATDLSERLGAIRAQLRQSSAQGLQNLGAQALQPTVENVMRQGQPGFGQPFAEGLGKATGAAITGGFGQAFGSTSPYGGSGLPSSPRWR